jgi:hypothetical protein
MTKYITDDGYFQVTDTVLNASWQAFNHKDGNYADLGMVN